MSHSVLKFLVLFSNRGVTTLGLLFLHSGIIPLAGGELSFCFYLFSDTQARIPEPFIVWQEIFQRVYP